MSELPSDQFEKTRMFVLEWLSKEEWSAYGECEGAALSSLLDDGLAVLAHKPPTGRTGVAITPSGLQKLATAGIS